MLSLSNSSHQNILKRFEHWPLRPYRTIVWEECLYVPDYLTLMTLGPSLLRDLSIPCVIAAQTHVAENNCKKKLFFVRIWHIEVFKNSKRTTRVSTEIEIYSFLLFHKLLCTGVICRRVERSWLSWVFMNVFAALMRISSSYVFSVCNLTSCKW